MFIPHVSDINWLEIFLLATTTYITSDSYSESKYEIYVCFRTNLGHPLSVTSCTFNFISNFFKRASNAYSIIDATKN